VSWEKNLYCLKGDQIEKITANLLLLKNNHLEAWDLHHEGEETKFKKSWPKFRSLQEVADFEGI